MEQTDSLAGVVDKIVYQNKENGFIIFTLITRSREKISIKGHAVQLNPGERVTLEGNWITHPKFGKQFEAKRCTSKAPDSIIGLKKYLGSGLIKGIGPTYAQKLVDAFGAQTLEIIDKDPQRLAQVPGIGKVRIASIVKGWQEQKEISHIMVFLQERGVSTAYATKIFKTYGARAIEIVTENPYRLADDIWGVGFKTADALAQRMGFAHDSLKRITAGILFSLAQETALGHLYSNLDDLKEKVIELLELQVTEVIQAKIKAGLHELYNSQKIVLISPMAHEHLISLAQHYFSEKGVAHKLLHLQKQTSRITLNMHAIYQKIRIQEDNGQIALNDDQQRAIMNALSHKISIITGGPGTGKTTVIKKIIMLLEEYDVSYKLVAPTGRAAKRMSESTHRYAETIHRLLEFDPSFMGFGKNEENALALDFLIIDESSMIDIFLAHSILKAVPYHAHILFIGDVDQLPSVGPGNFLKDMIASNVISCARLTHIFRQAQDSLIIRNAHRVNNGEFLQSFDPDARRDFFFIKEELPENIPLHLEKIMKMLPKYGIRLQDATILAPMHRGAAGTQKINSDIQAMLNPHNTEETIQYQGTTYKKNDRVMQLRNNYDKMVFNGDIGTIIDIHTQDRVMIISFYGTPIEYEYAEMDEITLAYAVSIHKSQGSEYAAAIIVIFLQHFTLLQRNLLYTAITRAKQLCIIIGQPKAVGMAVKNNKSLIRKTLLQQFLTSDLKCR